uniref:F-box domain-containing protein n=1 Tax=Chromera velia CCMP2878 TaxID=1169474 RepID=A0A0G4FTM1_9ALVE|eukprot:Cvel_18569.t1-p1 / transcript=Cvel_18569.t1 / gene=Cvel_18569 / organism=Chromera_velia_CCMP2878 / gene_product=hypothetical protein / transcript_product=hypothetical protein / location=Cvel_scaffold1547:42464-42730(+) / protein_length=89 / sequence_SO=supercontig / SO=protein_coding / is_pseudo=false
MTEARTTPDNTRCPGVWLFVLLRVPLSDRPVVSLVCRNWKDIVDSERFSKLRRQFGCAETTLVALTWEPPQQAEEGGRLSVFVKEGGHS